MIQALLLLRHAGGDPLGIGFVVGLMFGAIGTVVTLVVLYILYRIVRYALR